MSRFNFFQMEINQKLFLSLTSLGYTETQVRNALEISNNNITEARQHLFTNVFLNNQDKNTLQYLNEIEKDIINDEEPNNEIPDFIDSKELIKFVAGFAFCRLKFLRQSIKVTTHLIQKQELFLEFNDSDDFIKAFVQSVNQYLHNDTTNIYSPYFSSYPPLDHSFYDNLINDSLDVPKYKGYNITFIGEEKNIQLK